MTDQMQKNDQVQKTDKELLARFIQSSDETAVDELVKRYTPMVFRTGYRVLLDVHEANDVAQATFIVLIKKADSLKSVSNLGAWLHTVARNAAVNALRMKVRRKTREKQSMLDFSTQDSDHSENLREILYQNLDQKIGKLTDNQRQAVILRYLQGYSEKESASIAGCTIDALSRRAYDGLTLLRKRLGHINPAFGISSTTLVSFLNNEAKEQVSSSVLSSVKSAVLSAKAGSLAAGGTNANLLAKGVLKMMFWRKVKIVAAAIIAIAVVPSAVIIAQNIGTGLQDKGTPEKNSVSASISEQKTPNPGIEKENRQTQKTDPKAGMQKASPKKAKPNPTNPLLPDVLNGTVYCCKIPVGAIKDRLTFEEVKKMTSVQVQKISFKRDAVNNVKFETGKELHSFNIESAPDNYLKITSMVIAPWGSPTQVYLVRLDKTPLLIEYSQCNQNPGWNCTFIEFENLTNSTVVTDFAATTKDIDKEKMEWEKKTLLKPDMDFQAELARLEELPKGGERNKVLEALAVNWMIKDFENASEWIIRLPQDDLNVVLRSIGMSEVIELELEAKLLDKLPYDNANPEFINFGKRWATSDLTSAKEWLLKMPEGKNRYQAAWGIVPSWAEKEPEDAAKVGGTVIRE